MNLTQVISFCKERSQSLQSCLDATTDIHSILQNGSSLWWHPIKQGARNICDTESCGGSSADDRTMKCPKFVVSRKETSRVQAQVMKKWMVRLKMAKRANADLLRLRNSYIQTFLFLIISNFYVQSTPPTIRNSWVAINCDMSRPSLPNKGILSHAKAHVKATTCRNRKYPARRKSIG